MFEISSLYLAIGFFLITLSVGIFAIIYPIKVSKRISMKTEENLKKITLLSSRILNTVFATHYNLKELPLDIDKSELLKKYKDCRKKYNLLLTEYNFQNEIHKIKIKELEEKLKD